MATVPTEELTRSQILRRERVVRSAMELAAEGGYDAVQMRDVAARAHVALGTIYRYFSSKDHLLAAGLVEWAGQLLKRLQQRPLKSATVADRLVEVLRSSTRTLERQPSMGAAMITAITGSDPSVSQCQQEVSQVMVQILEMAMGDEMDPGLREGVVSVLLHVWYSALRGWVNGWRNVASVGDELENAARLLCRGLPG
jgi:AcrR family transcriptional regulator